MSCTLIQTPPFAPCLRRGVLPLILALFGIWPTLATAQGLLGLGKSGSTINESSPLGISIGVETGFDSNTNTASGAEANSSFFYGGNVGLEYAMADETTRLDLGARFSALFYDNATSNRDTFYNSRASVNYTKELNDRLYVSNRFLAAYEIEPDYELAVSSALREDQYLLIYDQIALGYQWTERLGTVSSYSFQSINYEGGEFARAEDRMSHLLTQQIRYALTRRTTATAEYRYGITDYDVTPNDSTSHFALLGMDHRFTEYTAGTLTGGAEHRNYDSEEFNSFTNPYVEGLLTHRMAERSELRWASRVGSEDNEVAGFRDRFSYRTSLTASHGLTDMIRGVLGVTYIASDFNDAGGSTSLSEDAIQLNASLIWALHRALALRTGYDFTTYSSDEAERDYDRHRVSVGVTSSF